MTQEQLRRNEKRGNRRATVPVSASATQTSSSEYDDNNAKNDGWINAITGPFQASTWAGPKLAKPAKVGNNVLAALQGYLPAYQKMIEGMAPQEGQLNADLFSQLLPQYADIGSQVGGADQIAGIGNDLGAINGGGLALASQAGVLEKAASPEWAASMQGANTGYQNLLSGMDPNKLSGSEMANVERGVNRLNARTGNLNVGDSTTTTSNAMTFGGALDAKRQRFGEALNLFPGLSSASKSSVNAFDVGTGKTSKPNVGIGLFNPQQGSPSAETAQREFFGASGIQQSGLAQQPSSGERFGNGIGSVCCFIMAEAYGFGKVPASVRMCRDFYYRTCPGSAVGYRKMASWLVPMMQKSKIVRYAANFLMIKPLTAYSQYLTGESQWKRIFKPAKLWINFWNFYGNC